MGNENETFVDKIWIQIKNNRFLAIIIVLGAITVGVSTFSDSLVNIFKVADDLVEDSQSTDIIESTELFPSSTFESYFNTSFEIADKDENDIVNLSKDGISIDFSINNDLSDLKYTVKKKDEQLIINPYNNYLSLLKKGGPITPLGEYYRSTDFQFPTLDFKIINNSDKVIYFT